MLNLKSKIILITGCSSGFGYVAAKYLGEKGCTVIPTVRKKSDLTKFPNTGLLDVTWPQLKINRFIYSVIKKYGRIDVLINNAGYGHLGTIGTFTMSDIQKQFETNFFGVFKVTQSILPSMRERRSGLIINISSIAGLVTTAGYGIYSASKFALEALTTSLRAEESLFDVDVVALNPGSFSTKFWQNEQFPPQSSDSNPILDGLNHKIKIFTKRNHLNSPEAVVKKIESIIVAKKRFKNYLVGWDAHLIYFVYRLLPQRIFDWLIKKAVKRLA